ncbi:DUF2255 family protein [Ornithinimicrobium faecis]|uniref:DUF2255 family protein n=1 Tax=Ornithinimicrobium faecis TaxID=2934158 RepID=A0ABY4YXJ3_9MICO|nr:DUF2255 family protein [Ornithinimicrobium sp. HY1793]USQ81078.1 DUF2255 family protein [Ornithinimicrobium sp. HY1793]
MSFDTAVDLFDEADVVAIVTTRANGSPIATPIWSVVVDGVPYLRSAFGPDSWWYRHVLAGRPAALAMGDGHLAEQDRAAALDLPREPVSTTYVPGDDPVQAAIDAELTRKYLAGPSVDAMLSAAAIACTLRVEPV